MVSVSAEGQRGVRGYVGSCINRVCPSIGKKVQNKWKSLPSTGDNLSYVKNYLSESSVAKKVREKWQSTPSTKQKIDEIIKWMNAKNHRWNNVATAVSFATLVGLACYFHKNTHNHDNRFEQAGAWGDPFTNASMLLNNEGDTEDFLTGSFTPTTIFSIIFVLLVPPFTKIAEKNPKRTVPLGVGVGALGFIGTSIAKLIAKPLISRIKQYFSEEDTKQANSDASFEDGRNSPNTNTPQAEVPDLISDKDKIIKEISRRKKVAGMGGLAAALMKLSLAYMTPDVAQRLGLISSVVNTLIQIILDRIEYNKKQNKAKGEGSHEAEDRSEATGDEKTNNNGHTEPRSLEETLIETLGHDPKDRVEITIEGLFSGLLAIGTTLGLEYSLKHIPITLPPFAKPLIAGIPSGLATAYALKKITKLMESIIAPNYSRKEAVKDNMKWAYQKLFGRKPDQSPQQEAGETDPDDRET
ncbi:MAG: hypothetical protein AAF621_05480 [Pseudomonadota bacterium]